MPIPAPSDIEMPLESVCKAVVQRVAGGVGVEELKRRRREVAERVCDDLDARTVKRIGEELNKRQRKNDPNRIDAQSFRLKPEDLSLQPAGPSFDVPVDRALRELGFDAPGAKLTIWANPIGDNKSGAIRLTIPF